MRGARRPRALPGPGGGGRQAGGRAASTATRSTTQVKKQAGDGARAALPAQVPGARRPPQRRAAKTIALVYGVGGVTRGESDFDPLFGERLDGRRTRWRAALRAAADDDDVKAIVFRVDSPGGSYVASDTIWREVARARKEGKPVIVSHGRRRRLGRLLRRHGRRQDRRPAGHHHRLDRRARRQDGAPRSCGRSSASPWTSVHAGDNADMFTGSRTTPRASGRASRPGSTASTPTSRARSAEGRKLPQEQGAGDRQGPRLDGRGRQGGSAWWTSWAASRWRCAWPRRRPKMAPDEPCACSSSPAASVPGGAVRRLRREQRG